jgi:hypothetical protein
MSGQWPLVKKLQAFVPPATRFDASETKVTAAPAR